MIKSLNIFVISTVFLLTANLAGAQILKPVKWSFSSQKINSTESYLIFTATIGKGWHIYATSLPPGDGPIPTSFKFTAAKNYKTELKIEEVKKPVIEFDKTFDKKIGTFSGIARFRQKIKTKPGSIDSVKGSLEFMVCNSSQCLPPETVEFSIPLK